MKKNFKMFFALLAFLVVFSLGVYFWFFHNSSKEVDFAEVGLSKTSLPPVTLTFYLPGQKPYGADDVVKEIERRTKNILNIKLDFEWMDGNKYMSTFVVNPKYELKYDACTIIFAGGQFYKNQNLPLDISKLFPKYAPNYYSKFSAGELAPGSINGKLYEIPNRYPTMKRYYAIIREDLRVKYGLPEIKNYDDLSFFVQTIAKKEKDIIPIFIQNYATSEDLFANANGYVSLGDRLGLVYRWDDPKMKIAPWEQTPEYKKVINMMNQWKEAGGVLQSNPMFPDIKTLYSGKCACILDEYKNIGEIDKYGANLGVKYKEYSLYAGMKSERVNDDMGIAINPKSPNSARVLMFIEWLQSNPKNYDLLVYGIEGRDYELIGDQIKPLSNEGTNNPYFNWNNGNFFTNYEYNRSIVGSPVDKKYYEKINKNSKFPPHSGFNIDEDKIMLGLCRYRTQTRTKIEESIASGNFSTEMIDDYIKQQN